jgi:hypothetical protein
MLFGTDSGTEGGGSLLMNNSGTDVSLFANNSGTVLGLEFDSRPNMVVGFAERAATLSRWFSFFAGFSECDADRASGVLTLADLTG